MSDDLPPTVGFVGGLGRSGSTLIERVVAAVPGLCALGEVRLMWHRGVLKNELCACGEPFHDCPFWTKIGHAAFGGWDNVDVDHVQSLSDRVDRMRNIPASAVARAGSHERAMEHEYADYYARVYAAATAVSGASVVLDSSKNACTAYALRVHEAIDLRVVHIVRDSRGVAYSWTKQVARPEAGDDSALPMMERYAPWRSAVLWDAHNLAFTALPRFGVPVHRVLYEQFIADPVGTTAEVVRFVGADPAAVSEVVGATSAQLNTNHQVAGNPMRFQQGEITIRADEAWRRELPAADRRMVTALTWPGLARYGYRSR